MNDDEIMKVIKQCSRKGENDYCKEAFNWEAFWIYSLLIGISIAVGWMLFDML